jgi:formylglycine-generating enzyme
MRTATLVRASAAAAAVAMMGCNAFLGSEWGELADRDAGGGAAGGQGGGAAGGQGGGAAGGQGGGAAGGQGGGAAGGQGGGAAGGDATTDSATGGTGGDAGADSSAGGTGGTESGVGGDAGADIATGGTGGGDAGSGGTGGDAGPDGLDATVDACSPETDAAFCARLGTTCGTVTATDNCGTSRVVASCGTCTGTGVTCGSSNVCQYVPSSLSCSGGLTCGASDSCCTSIVIPGGTFPQGRSTISGASDYYSGGGAAEAPEFLSTVSTFALDKYEVTVGRFRKFVDAYGGGDSGPVWRPQPGDGKNPNVPVTADASDNGTGWQSAWNTNLPATQAALRDTSHLTAYSGYTWTDGVGPNENKAINTVSWYEAFAFCIWDGGRLATESEWEYAAAGGQDNRLFPWGSTTPDCTYANFNVGSYCSGGSGSVVAVGSTPKGNGRWGHADLGGNVYEWTLDWYGTYPTSAATNYANISSGSYRTIRGGDFYDSAGALRGANRYNVPVNRSDYLGFRCARATP